jgi:hypothetical protein
MGTALFLSPQLVNGQWPVAQPNGLPGNCTIATSPSEVLTKSPSIGGIAIDSIVWLQESDIEFYDLDGRGNKRVLFNFQQRCVVLFALSVCREILPTTSPTSSGI